MSFAGKVAVVTGGTSGIGLAAARMLVERGARVVVAGRDPERGARAVAALQAAAGGGAARFVRADVARAADVEALIAEAVSAFGRLDIALNNAAVLVGDGERLAEQAEADWDACMGPNLRGVWLCMRAQIRQLLAQGAGGAIVNTSSVNGLGGAARAALYSAAKAGVHALTKSAAIDYAPDGIRVNALAAGPFDTPMLRSVFEGMRAQGADPAQVEAAFVAAVPLARIGRPEEAAAAAVWLASDEASYVTGHTMIVDGGLTAFAR